MQFTEKQENTEDEERRREDILVWKKREKFAKRRLKIEDKMKGRWLRDERQ